MKVINQISIIYNDHTTAAIPLYWALRYFRMWPIWRFFTVLSFRFALNPNNKVILPSSVWCGTIQYVIYCTVLSSLYLTGYWYLCYFSPYHLCHFYVKSYANNWNTLRSYLIINNLLLKVLSLLIFSESNNFFLTESLECISLYLLSWL